MRPDGGVFASGSVFTVVREYTTTGFRDRNRRTLALGDEHGNIVLPCVDPGTVMEISDGNEQQAQGSNR